MSFFLEAVTHVLQLEGGFSNDPNDHGGATNHGITIETLKRWRGGEVTVEDVKSLSVTEAKDIYRAYYWAPLGLDQCTNKVAAIALLDQSVNRGPYRATVDAQSTLNGLGFTLKVDGVLGEVTMAALNLAQPVLFLKNLFKRAQLGYVSIVVHDHSQLRYLEGWVKRTHSLLDL